MDLTEPPRETRTIYEPPPGQAVVVINRNGLTDVQRVPAQSLPRSDGIPASASEVMIGQRWVRFVGVAAGLSGLGVAGFAWLSPAWVTFLTDPETVSVLIGLSSAAVWAANEVLGRYIRKGRLNGGVAPARIIDSS